METKPDIEAWALGETRVLVDSRPISETEWRSNRAKEIFFYLLCCHTGQTKEQIAVALWPNLSPAKATSNFHINLYRARRAVFPGIFILEQGQYKLNPDVNIRFDLVEFENLLSQAESLPQNSKAKAVTLGRAIELYRGPFLGEFYSEWTEIQRRKLEDKYLKALSFLAGFYGDRGRYDMAIKLLEKFLTIDPYQDEVYCRLMKWHLAVEDKISALRTYKRYLDTVADELDFTPPTQIQDLYKRALMSTESG